MAPKLYATRDPATSIRHALAGFTHVNANVSYGCIRPLLFDSKKLDVEPIFSWAAWLPASFAQRDRWAAEGGCLLDRNWMPNLAGAADVLVLLEAPLSLKRIELATRVAREAVVISIPVTWRQHELTIDLRTPPVETLQSLWAHCRGKRMTDQELADASGVPRSNVQIMRTRLSPQEVWDIRPRLAPEAAALMLAWNWINAAGDGSGISVPRATVRLAGHRAAVKELGKRGHVAVTKYQVYGTDEPDWKKLARRRATALADLAAVRAVVESLPDHIEM